MVVVGSLICERGRAKIGQMKNEEVEMWGKELVTLSRTVPSLQSQLKHDKLNF